MKYEKVFFRCTPAKLRPSIQRKKSVSALFRFEKSVCGGMQGQSNTRKAYVCTYAFLALHHAYLLRHTVVNKSLFRRLEYCFKPGAYLRRKYVVNIYLDKRSVISTIMVECYDGKHQPTGHRYWTCHFI